MSKCEKTSDIKFYIECFEHILLDCCVVTNSRIDYQRDIETIKSRCQTEGLSFLTKSLPKLGKSLEEGLENGLLVLPREFGRISRKDRRPAFLQAFFKRVFDASGALLEAVDDESIKFIRQTCYFLYKLELPFPKEVENNVVASFKETDQSLALTDSQLDFSLVLRQAQSIIGNIFKDFDPLDILPKHGPGSLATGERDEDKWEFSRLYESIHSSYPYYKYFVANPFDLLLNKGAYTSLMRYTSGVSKMCLVPKDSRGPRVISQEPLEYMYIQQGLLRSIVPHIEKHKLTAGRVNFTSQETNRTLARVHSVSRAMATLDLKDASDRVSLELVKLLFHTTQLMRYLIATRTTGTQLPNGEYFHYQKFAPMGSALCFPIEALCFWSICVGYLRTNGYSMSQSSSMVYVYGDDIIVPTEHMHGIVEALEFAGLKVNNRKSFGLGHFRESCGGDYYNGSDVTPVRLKTVWKSRKRRDPDVYLSYIALANNMKAKGYIKTYAFLQERLTNRFGPIPYGLKDSGYPCWIVDTFEEVVALMESYWPNKRYNDSLHRLEYLVTSLVSMPKRTKLDGYRRMLRNYLVPGLPDPTKFVPRSNHKLIGWRWESP